jgi:hypothetical protein
MQESSYYTEMFKALKSQACSEIQSSYDTHALNEVEVNHYTEPFSLPNYSFTLSNALLNKKHFTKRTRLE